MKQKLSALGIALVKGMGNSLPVNAADFEMTLKVKTCVAFNPLNVASIMKKAVQS